MNHPLKTLHAEIRRFLKCFPADKDLYNIKIYPPTELKDGPFIEIEIQRAKGAHWEHYKLNFVLTSVHRIRDN